MPMSISRAAASGAPLACSVVSTRCPVSAASIAIWAVSTSRISPTMITSGSARTIARSPVAKVRPVFVFVWICLTPSISYSTGSSTVTIVRSGRVERASRPRRGWWSCPSRSGRSRGWRRAWHRSRPRRRTRSASPMPRRSRSITTCRESRMRITTRFAAHHRQGRHAQVHVVAVDRQADAAVLRRALLGDVELGHDLDPGDEPGDEVARDGRGVEDHAVHAEAHAHVARARLEVDVGGAAAHRVGDHRVHELHDRRVVRRLAQLDDLRLDLVVIDLVDRAPRASRGSRSGRRCPRARRPRGAPRSPWPW